MAGSSTGCFTPLVPAGELQLKVKEQMIKSKRSAEQQVADEADRRALNPIASRQTISDSQADPEFQKKPRAPESRAAGSRGVGAEVEEMTFASHPERQFMQYLRGAGWIKAG